MTRNEAAELLDLAAEITHTMRMRPGQERALRTVRDRLVELAGGVDCQHCESDNGCERCSMGWALPEEVTL